MESEMKSHLQKTLKEKGLSAVAELGISIKRHPEYNNLVQFTYDQIESPKGDPVVQTSRGHILDEANDWEHVSRPFDRFFNHNEGAAPKINPKEFSFFRKEDGTLCCLWFYNGGWHVSTKGTPNASGEIESNGLTFSEFFWETFQKQGFSTQNLVQGNTYVFELCSLDNRIVIPYEKPKLFLLTVRNNLTGTEIIPYESEGGVKETKFDSIEEILESFKTTSGLRNEGYVAVSHANPRVRVKIKHPEYVCLHRQISGTNTKSLLTLVRMNEGDEFLSLFPEYQEEYDKMKEAYEKLLLKLEKIWEATKEIEVQRDFALAIQGVQMAGVLFSARKTKKTIRTLLAEIPIDALYKNLEVINE